MDNVNPIEKHAQIEASAAKWSKARKVAIVAAVALAIIVAIGAVVLVTRGPGHSLLPALSHPAAGSNLLEALFKLHETLLLYLALFAVFGVGAAATALYNKRESQKRLDKAIKDIGAYKGCQNAINAFNNEEGKYVIYYETNSRNVKGWNIFSFNGGKLTKVYMDQLPLSELKDLDLSKYGTQIVPE